MYSKCSLSAATPFQFYIWPDRLHFKFAILHFTNTYLLSEIAKVLFLLPMIDTKDIAFYNYLVGQIIREEVKAEARALILQFE